MVGQEAKAGCQRNHQSKSPPGSLLRSKTERQNIMNTKHLITAIAALLMALGSTALAERAPRKNPLSMIVPPQSRYEGKTYSEWLQAAEIRRWNIPSTGVAPYFGAPEYEADPQQLQGGPVFFLDFSWNLDPFNPMPGERHATVPEGTAILADIDGFFTFLGTVDDARAYASQWTFIESFKIDGVEIPIGNSLASPFWTAASFDLFVPGNSATVAMLSGGESGVAGTYPYSILELIAIIKPLPPGEHLIEIKGGNTSLADPQGSMENIWWNWVKWHITVTPAN